MSPLFFCVLLCFVQSPNKHSYKSPNPEFALHRKKCREAVSPFRILPTKCSFGGFFGVQKPTSAFHFTIVFLCGNSNFTHELFKVALGGGFAVLAALPKSTRCRCRPSGHWSFGSLTYDPPCFRSLLTASLALLSTLIKLSGIWPAAMALVSASTIVFFSFKF